MQSLSNVTLTKNIQNAQTSYETIKHLISLYRSLLKDDEEIIGIINLPDGQLLIRKLQETENSNIIIAHCLNSNDEEVIFLMHDTNIQIQLIVTKRKENEPEKTIGF